MKNYSRGIIQLVFVFVFIFLLLRFFPLVVRIGQTASLSIMKFWWIVLIFALSILLIWVLKKRKNN